MSKLLVAVTTQYCELIPEAKRLAQVCAIPYLPLVNTCHFEFLLRLMPERLELQHNSNAKPVYVDFIKGAAGYRSKHSGRKQLLARAVGLAARKQLKILDLTAGLGYDAFILAQLGAEIHSVERSSVVAALLQDGLRRARQKYPQLTFDLTVGDSFTVLKELVPQFGPNVIYLDPMYPVKQSTALPKKEMRWLRALLGDDLDAAYLLQAALTYPCHRIVVKRPLYAPKLGGLQPSLIMRGTRCRYDIYFR